jgi:sugar lactone lactonase YvrE
MANSIIRLTLSELASTAALGVNLTNADIVAKYEAGPTDLSARGGSSIGGVCTDNSGNIYISDMDEHVILKVNEGGEVSVFAGLAGTSGVNGTLTKVAAGTARFNTPKGIACDNTGRVYVADSGNNQIRVIHDGFVSHLAGAGDGASGLVDGTGADARFDDPADVCVDPTGTVYVCDRGNHSIRKVTSGTVLTFAGSASGDQDDVAGTAGAIFNSPNAITCDNNGELYVCDSGNFKIKRITQSGYVYLFSGSGTQGKVKGTTAFDGRYNDLQQSDMDNTGNLYVVDNNSGSGSRLVMLDKLGIQRIVNDFTGASGYNDELAGVAVSPAGKLFAVVSATGAYESSSTSSEGESSSSSS